MLHTDKSLEIYNLWINPTQKVGPNIRPSNFHLSPEDRLPMHTVTVRMTSTFIIPGNIALRLWKGYRMGGTEKKTVKSAGGRPSLFKRQAMLVDSVVWNCILKVVYKTRIWGQDIEIQDRLFFLNYIGRQLLIGIAMSLSWYPEICQQEGNMSCSEFAGYGVGT